MSSRRLVHGLAELTARLELRASSLVAPQNRKEALEGAYWRQLSFDWLKPNTEVDAVGAGRAKGKEVPISRSEGRDLGKAVADSRGTC